MALRQIGIVIQVCQARVFPISPWIRVSLFSTGGLLPFLFGRKPLFRPGSKGVRVVITHIHDWIVRPVVRKIAGSLVSLLLQEAIVSAIRYFRFIDVKGRKMDPVSVGAKQRGSFGH